MDSKTLEKWQKRIKQEKETPKLPLKLHYGSKLPSKSLQKWLKNQYQSQVATKPPRSTRMNPYKKKKKTYYTRRRVSNNMIETRTMSSNDYIVHNGGEETP